MFCCGKGIDLWYCVLRILVIGVNKFASIFLCLIAVHKHQEMSSMIYSYILNIGYARRNKKADTGYRIQDICTLIKKKIKYKEIQSGAVAKSYLRKGFLTYEEMRKYFPIYEEAVGPIRMTLQLLHFEFPYI